MSREVLVLLVEGVGVVGLHHAHGELREEGGLDVAVFEPVEQCVGGAADDVRANRIRVAVCDQTPAAHVVQVRSGNAERYLDVLPVGAGGGLRSRRRGLERPLCRWLGLCLRGRLRLPVGADQQK